MRKSCFLACPCSVLLCLLLLARCIFWAFLIWIRSILPLFGVCWISLCRCWSHKESRARNRGNIVCWAAHHHFQGCLLLFAQLLCVLHLSLLFPDPLFNALPIVVQRRVRKQRKRWRRSGASNAQAIAIHRVFNIVVTMLNIVTLWSQCSTPRSQWLTLWSQCLTLWSQCLTLWSQFPAIFWRPNPLCACVRGSQTWTCQYEALLEFCVSRECDGELFCSCLDAFEFCLLILWPVGAG